MDLNLHPMLRVRIKRYELLEHAVLDEVTLTIIYDFNIA